MVNAKNKMAEIKRKSDIDSILRKTHPFRLTVTDIENEKDTEYYINDNLMDEIYQLLRTRYKETDQITNLPYIIQEKDILDKTTEEIKSMLGLNYNIQYKDFVIVSTAKINECEKNNHNITKMQVDVPIVYKNSNIEETTITAYHCTDCKLYYITDNDYINISKKGSMLCQHMTWNDYKEYIKNLESGFIGFNKESLLKRYGYSVSQIDGLKETERHTILSYIIEVSPKDDNGNIWDKNMIVWFLKNQIKMHPHFEKAVEKWECDLEFLEDYSHSNPIVIKIRRVIHK